MRGSAAACTFLACIAGLAFGAPAAAQVMLLDGGGRYTLPVVSLYDIPFRTVVRQKYDYSCGSAALATLLHFHYGLPVGEADIFKVMYARGDQAKIRKVGFSLLDMRDYLASQGYAADGYKMTYDQLLALGSPAITIIQVKTYRHFVVVKGVSADRVLVGDPAEGLRTYTRSDFEKVWQGIIFVVHDAAAIYNDDREWRPYAAAPLDTPLSDESLSAFTRALPQVDQITPVFSLNDIRR